MQPGSLFIHVSQADCDAGEWLCGEWLCGEWLCGEWLCGAGGGVGGDGHKPQLPAHASCTLVAVQQEKLGLWLCGEWLCGEWLCGEWPCG